MVPKFKFEIKRSRGPEFEALTPLEKQGMYNLESWKDPRKGYLEKYVLAAFLHPKFSEMHLEERNGEKLKKKEHAFETILTQLGLKFFKESNVRGGWHQTTYIFGKNDVPESAKKYIQRPTREPANPSAYHREFGSLMGIPLTAINAFVEGDTYPIATVLENAEVAKFRWFAPSKKYWRAEDEQVSEFAGKVRSISPILYDRIMAR